MVHEDKVAKAEKRVREMDECDGREVRDPETILAALECGLNRPETNAHYDALVMLRDVVRMQREESKTKPKRS